jgi:hypothetical protein
MAYKLVGDPALQTFIGAGNVWKWMREDAPLSTGAESCTPTHGRAIILSSQTGGSFLT